MYAKVNGTRLYFDIEGAGYVPDGPMMRQKPVCFILHGGPGGDHTGFKPALSPLSEHMQLVYIDHRGCGLSERGPQSTYTLENNIEDIEALRQYLGFDKIIIFGQSYGGMVAQAYASKYKENLQALLLGVTSPAHRFVEKAKDIVNEKGTEEQKQMVEILFEGTFESEEQHQRYYEVMAPLYSYSYDENNVEQRKAREQAGSRAKRSYQALNEGFGRFLREFDVIDQLPKIDVPTLIIGGRHDWITPVEASMLIHEKLPDSELVIFENSSHQVAKDEYDLFISTLVDFVNRRVIESKLSNVY
ncbi:alpha/beta fold hydrolase [Neobacillus sp. NPDC058068]|uniref:alpha/beta fold hydrolase n=1 Tax=Neobacillus sp. NPDC058068 TaxID=3346325 RepID=UPI0036DDDE30